MNTSFLSDLIDVAPDWGFYIRIENDRIFVKDASGNTILVLSDDGKGKCEFSAHVDQPERAAAMLLDMGWYRKGVQMT